jgi:hypothetical protein
MYDQSIKYKSTRKPHLEIKWAHFYFDTMRVYSPQTENWFDFKISTELSVEKLYVREIGTIFWIKKEIADSELETIIESYSEFLLLNG